MSPEKVIISVARVSGFRRGTGTPVDDGKRLRAYGNGAREEDRMGSGRGGSEYRLFVTDDLFMSATIDLEPHKTHYLLSVLRMRQDDTVLLFNGRHGEWRGAVSSVYRKGCRLQVVDFVRSQTGHGDMWYVFGPPKGVRQDYLVQKATEMGASRLCPALMDRGNVRHFNVNRAHANVIEAAEQCGILSLPLVDEMRKMDTYLDHWDPARWIVLCDERAPVADPIRALREIRTRSLAVFVGPEGGFSGQERARLHTLPFVTSVSLGPRIMRADTAAVAVMSLVQAVQGDYQCSLAEKPHLSE